MPLKLVVLSMNIVRKSRLLEEMPVQNLNYAILDSLSLDRPAAIRIAPIVIRE